MARLPQITIEGAKMIFRNLRGEKTKFKPEGIRSFSVLLDEKEAENLMNDGLNVKKLKMKEDDDEQKYHLPIAVSYKIKDPAIYIITDKLDGTQKKTLIGEEELMVVDHAHIINADLILQPSEYNIEELNKKGIKVYLESAYIEIKTDRLAQKYADI